MSGWKCRSLSTLSPHFEPPCPHPKIQLHKNSRAQRLTSTSSNNVTGSLSPYRPQPQAAPDTKNSPVMHVHSYTVFHILAAQKEEVKKRSGRGKYRRRQPRLRFMVPPFASINQSLDRPTNNEPNRSQLRSVSA